MKDINKKATITISNETINLFVRVSFESGQTNSEYADDWGIENKESDKWHIHPAIGIEVSADSYEYRGLYDLVAQVFDKLADSIQASTQLEPSTCPEHDSWDSDSAEYYDAFYLRDDNQDTIKTFRKAFFKAFKSTIKHYESK